MKKILLAMLAIISMVALVACGENKGSADTKVVKYCLEQNPPQLDPQITTDETSGIVLGHIFEGLTIIGKDGKPIYTFNIVK